MGEYDLPTDKESPRIKVTLATCIPKERCGKRLSLGYLNPDEIDLETWKGEHRRGKLCWFQKAGEMLYRVRAELRGGKTSLHPIDSKRTWGGYGSIKATHITFAAGLKLFRKKPREILACSEDRAEESRSSIGSGISSAFRKTPLACSRNCSLPVSSNRRPVLAPKSVQRAELR